MKKFMFLLCLFFVAPALAIEPEKVAGHLQKTSVNVKSNSSQGSGSLVLRKIGGEDIAFVITAAHVVDGLRTVNTIIGSDGKDKKVVSYRDASVLQERVENGQTVGEVKVSCKVIAVTYKHDIAILQVRWPGLYHEGIEFELSSVIPSIGTELFHCGSPGGQDIGFNTVTDGIMSASGRMIDMGHGIQPYDQITCSSLPGSSGGAVVRKRDGVYVGTLTLGIRGGDSFSWIVPVRRTVKWAQETGLSYIFDPSAKAMSRADLDKIHIEAGDDGKVSRDTAGGQVLKTKDLLNQIKQGQNEDRSLFDILTRESR